MRPAFDALFGIDDALGDVVQQSTQPSLGAIKLAWWRERLEGLDRGELPAEPRLQVAASELLPRGITGADLAGLEAGWSTLLDESQDAELALGRGALLFALAGRLFAEAPARPLDGAGRLYAAGNLQRRGLALHAALPTIGLRVPRRFRPITGMAVLAKRDLLRREDEATPGRAWALFRHRITGQL